MRRFWRLNRGALDDLFRGGIEAGFIEIDPSSRKIARSMAGGGGGGIHQMIHSD